jgi:methionine-rich copper-binding protein CopC
MSSLLDAMTAESTMPINLTKAVWTLALFALGTAVASAHTSAASTTPKTGSMLDRSPPAIEITFKEAARLTSVIVQQQGKPERKLAFEPNNAATTFKIDSPKLDEGKSEVHWVALSRDGHVVKGMIVLTVKASAAKTN